MVDDVKDSLEKAKRACACLAVDENVKNGDVVGIGSGSTIAYAIERLGQRKKEGGLEVVCVPTSYQARQRILENGLVLGDITTHPDLDIAIDGAGEIDSSLNALKGLSDYKKVSTFLGEKTSEQGVPIECLQFAHTAVMKEVRKLFGKPKLRMGEGNIGPFLSDNGNVVIDVNFGVLSNDVSVLDSALHRIPGVVETGLCVDMAEKAYLGQVDGSVVVKIKKSTL